MHFKVEQEIFEKLPNACFGVVVAKGIDNTKDYLRFMSGWKKASKQLHSVLKAKK